MLVDPYNRLTKKCSIELVVEVAIKCIERTIVDAVWFFFIHNFKRLLFMMN